MVRSGPQGALRAWAFLLFLMVLVTPPGWAQQPPQFELPEIEVAGKRPQPIASTPASVSVITRDELDKLAVRTVGDALGVLPEVMVQSFGGLGSLSQASIRGSTAQQVLVLLDGVPLNQITVGSADLSTISTDGVERIEVLRGPFSALYGSGALGGIINIVTAKPGREQALGHVGGYGERSLSATAGSTGPAPWLIGVTADGTAGHRVNSAYDGLTAIGKTSFSSTLRGLVHYYQSEFGSPGSISFPTPNDHQSFRRTILQMEWGPDDRSDLTGLVYQRSERLVFTSPVSGNSLFDSSVTGLEVQRPWQLDAGHLLTGGIELQRQFLNANVSGSPIVQDIVVGAAYLQYDAAISPRVLASLGVRQDSLAPYGSSLDPRAGIIYRINDETRLRAAVGRTFRAPTFLDLYFPGFGNPNLRPERAWEAELGIERQVGSLVLSATAFGTDATDLITFVSTPVFQAVNVGSASIRGISGEVRGALGTGLTGSANITVQSAIDQTTGATLRRVPGLRANLVLHYQLSPSSVVSLVAEYVGDRPDPPVQLPSYVDLLLRYELSTSGGWIWTVGVNNALDQSYQVVNGYPAPGRTVFVNATKSF